MEDAGRLRAPVNNLNPLRCDGTVLPVPLLLMAKLIALALLLTNHVRLLPDPFLSFIPALDHALPGPVFQLSIQVLFVVAAVAILFNRSVRLGCLVLGATILLAVVSSKAYYGNNKTFCGVMLFLIGLYERPASVWLVRAQLVIVYFGAGLNKLLDTDWQSGKFFHYWAAERLHQPLYIWVAAMLPPLVAGKLACWMTIVTELGLPPALLLPRLWPYAVWVSLLFHVGLLEFTGSTFTMFFYAMESAVLAFVVWPREKIVIYDGDCGICNKIRRRMESVDFDKAFQWTPLQTGAGARFGISRSAAEDRLHLVADGKVSSGFRACKLILLYNPAFLLAVGFALAAPPADWAWYRRLVAGALLAFFFPMFDAVGDAVYNWVARNRYRFSSEGACALDLPPSKETLGS